MLILLPPSEGKYAPSRGKRLDLDTLSSPELTPARTHVLNSLVELCANDPDKAREVLGLPPGLANEVRRNAGLRTAPTAPAGRVYTGVLYDALSLGTLSAAAKRRASSRLLVTSSLFGLLRIGDRIPAYRLSGDANLPGFGTVASVWRDAMAGAMRPLLAKHLVLDLRSGTYASFWRPRSDEAARVVSVRVLHDANGARTVVSHFNKATKGRFVRSLLGAGTNPISPAAFARTMSELGWYIEPTPDRRNSYDVVVTDVSQGSAENWRNDDAPPP